MPSELVELIRNTLLIVGALLPIVNPLGNVPIFLTLTRGSSSATRTLLARNIAINGFFLLVASAFVGTYILDFFGISLPVVQVGGGLVVISTGWKLLNEADDEDEGARPSATDSAEHLSRRAFYPLTLPLTVGPGSISVALTLGANKPEGIRLNWPLLASELIGTAAIAVSIYLSYRYAETLAKAAGATAMSVIVRLSSFILVCIGVQILWNGASTLIRSVQ